MRRWTAWAAAALLVCALGGTAAAGTFGPDDFGYVGADQAEDGVTYEWIDMSGGTMLTPMGDDEMSAAVPIGFDFVFYGQTFTEVKVISNGIVALTPPIEYDIFGGTQCPLPYPNDLNGIVALWERDFNPDDAACGADCWIAYANGGEAPNRWFGVTFNAVPVFREAATDDADPVTVQVLLFEGTNEIKIQVAEAGVDAGGDSTTGIEAPDGIAGLAVPTCVTADSIGNESAFVFTPPSSGTPVVPPFQAAWDQPGETIEYTFTVFNLDAAQADFGVAVSGNAWDATLSAETLAVLPGESAAITVSVEIPTDAAGGAVDEALVTLTPTGAGEPLTVRALTLVQDDPDEWQVASHLPYVVDSPAVAVDGTDIWLLGGEVWDELSLQLGLVTEVQVLHTETMTWETSVDDDIAQMPEALLYATACALNGRIFVLGGFTTNAEAPISNAVHIYDIAANTWSQGAPMPQARVYHAMACDPDAGVIYVVGGSQAGEGDTLDDQAGLWKYEVGADSWDETLAAGPVPRSLHSVALVDGKLIVAGGFVEGLLDLRSDVYDIAADEWARTGDTSDYRLFNTTALLDGGRMCLIGGGAGSAYSWLDDTFECYSNGYWIPQIAVLNEARTLAVGATVGDTMYVIGGADTDNAFQPTAVTQFDLVERYPTSDLPEPPPVDESPADVAQGEDVPMGVDVPAGVEVIDNPDTNIGPQPDTVGPQPDQGGGDDTAAGPDSGGGGNGGGGGGGGCTAGGAQGPTAPVALLLVAGLLGVAVLRRRRA